MAVQGHQRLSFDCLSPPSAELEDHKKKPSSNSSHKREVERLKEENLSLQRKLRQMHSTSSTDGAVDMSLSSTEGGFENVTVDRKKG